MPKDQIYTHKGVVLAGAKWNCKGKDMDFSTFFFYNVSPPVSDSPAPDFPALRTSPPNRKETKLCNKVIQRERIRNSAVQKQSILKENL